jgi:uncharacterized SAM-binding protein YcdF (DUF218 family)
VVVPYAVSKLAIALLSPLGTALALALVGLLLQRPARRSGTVLLVFALAWLWLWSTPAVSEALQEQVESRYPALAAESLPKADAIVLLGGAMAPPARGHIYPDLGSAADRIWHAARVFRAGKAPLLLASGGSDPGVTDLSEAASMAGLLTEFGVPRASILLEDKSRTTGENARFSAPLLQSRGVKRILLVTSALHMPRAVAEFERAGFQVIPAATDHAQAQYTGVQLWLPDTDALDNSARTMKEVVGRAVIRR